MKEMLVWLATQVIPQDATPPIQCTAVNKLKEGTANIVGNIMGLQDLVPWIVGIFVVIAILVAAIPKLRKAVISNLLWVLAIALFGGVVVGAIVVFSPSHCA